MVKDRRIQRRGRLLAVLGMALLVPACVGVEDCDATQVGNIFTAGSCALSGNFEARVAQTRQAVNERQQEILAEQEITEEQRATAERLASDSVALERSLADQQYEIDRLTQRLSVLSMERDDIAAEVQALQGEIETAQAGLNRLETQTDLTPGEIAEARRRIKARHQALEDAVNALVVD